MIVATYLMGAHVYKPKSLASGAQLSGSGIFHPRKDGKRGDRLLGSELIASLPTHLLNESYLRGAGWGRQIVLKWRSPDRSVLHQLLMANTSQGGTVHRQLVTEMSARLPTDAVWLHQSEHKFAGHGCKSFCGDTCICDPFSWPQDPRTRRLSSSV